MDQYNADINLRKSGTKIQFNLTIIRTRSIYAFVKDGTEAKVIAKAKAHFFIIIYPN